MSAHALSTATDYREAGRGPRAECEFCVELKSSAMPTGWARWTGLRERTVLESFHACVWPSISPLRAGHLLVVPRSHVTSIAQLDASELVDTLRLLDGAAARLAARWGAVGVFEHGVGAGCAGGCGVDHAHAHVLPLGADELPRVLAAFEKAFPGSETRPLAEALHAVGPDDTYALVGTSASVALAVRDEVPSQLLRRIVGVCIGSSELDWRGLTGWDLFEESYRTLT